MLQNATPLRKSAPGRPNISDEHVSCTAPATENASLQILFKCPTPANAFETGYKTLTFCALLTRCTVPCACHAKRHLNVQKRFEPAGFLHFWLRNVLRATTVCTFSTSQLPKVVRHWCVCFVHFGFQMCFAPQWRAFLEHLNFQKCSEDGAFSTFWLWNALRATTARAFSTSQFLKVLRSWRVLYVLTLKCASRHTGVQFFISHPARWLRTRRFTEPTFRPSTIIGKTHWFATFLPFRAPASSFFSLFLFSDLLPSSLLWLFPPLLFHLSMLSEVWLLNFLR